MSPRSAVPSSNPSPDGWENVAALCGILSLPPRLKMIVLLAAGERAVNDLGTAVGLAQPLACHHLKVLRTAGIVSTRRAGRRVFYRLHDDGAVASAAGLTLHSADSRVHFTVTPRRKPNPPGGRSPRH